MTAEEFNKKYKKYLAKGHYGLDIDEPDFTKWLDEKFQEYIKVPGFYYTQIKEKFGYGRFYCEAINYDEVREVENKITELFKR